MISNNNLKNILSNLFNKSKAETDKQYNHLSTNMNKGWISSGTIEDIRNKNVNDATPVGSIISLMSNEAPPHYLICDGTEYNISDYQELSDFFKEQFGSANYFGGDGITTFAVPDLRGEFLRGTGTNSHENQGSGADIGTHQDATIHMNVDIHKEESTNYLSVSKDLPFGEYIIGNTADKVLNGSGLGRTWYAFSKSSTNSNDLVANYTSRPTNTSVLYCIKYESTTSLTINMYDGTHYSEDELLIGQWIDGKPLYRKVVKLTCPSTQTGTRASTYIDLSDLNIDSYVNCTSYLANYGILPASYNGAAANYYSVIDRFNLNRVAIESNWADHNNKQIISIIEYTKTTDEPFSVDEDIAFIALDSEVDEIINRLGE